MPAITRQGDTCTGHDDCPPSSLVGGESNVLIDGKPVGVVGSTYAPHGCDVHDPHSDVIASGSSTVFVNGKPVGRVGDAVSIGGTVASGSPTVTVDSLGPDDIVNFVKCTNNYIDNVNNLSEVDEVIFALPRIAQMEAHNNRDDESVQIGWLELSKMFAFWLSDKAFTMGASWEEGLAPVYRLSMPLSWYLSFNRFKEKFNELSKNALNIHGKNLLIKVLKSDPVWEKGGSFDFTLKEPKDWNKVYINSRKIDGDKREFIDGLNIALSSCNIKSLVSGNIKIKDNVRHITVSKLFIYVQDLFNFEGPQGYGYWSKKELDFWNLPLPPVLNGYYPLFNSSFEEFRERHNIGKDFISLSPTFEILDYEETKFTYTEN